MGEKIDVRLYKSIDGMKEFCGVLCGYNDGDFTVTLQNEEDVTISIKAASYIRPHIDF